MYGNINFQVLDLYNKIIIARKTVPQEEEEEFTKEFKVQADALLKQQVELNCEINGMTDIQMLY